MTGEASFLAGLKSLGHGIQRFRVIRGNRTAETNGAGSQDANRCDGYFLRILQDGLGHVTVIYIRIGQYREGIAVCREAIKMGDDGADARIYLGAAYAMAGEREKAGASFSSCETLNLPFFVCGEDPFIERSMKTPKRDRRK